MDKEEKEMSYQSTLTSSDQMKVGSPEETSIYLGKRNEDLNCVFDELMASVSDSSDESIEADRASEPRAPSRAGLGSGRRPPARKRKPQFEVEAAAEVQRKCANGNCGHLLRGDESSLVKTSYLTGPDYFCEPCAHAIAKRWNCPFCAAIYTDPSHALEKDPYTWVNCDEKKCGRWTHVECEEHHRGQEIARFLNDPNYKFFCSDCIARPKPHADWPSTGKKRTGSTVIKAETLPTIATPEDPVCGERPLFRDFFQVLNRCDQLTSFSYTYMYSDHYVAADRLSADKGKPLVLSEADIASDFEALLKATGDKRFVFSSNSTPQHVSMTDRLSNRKKQYKSVLDSRPL